MGTENLGKGKGRRKNKDPFYEEDRERILQHDTLLSGMINVAIKNTP